MVEMIKFYGAPGTGKTFTLVQKFEEAISLGYAPEEILCTQFRRDAALQVKQLIGQKIKVPQNQLKNVKTFHGLCYSLLQKHGYIKPDEKILLTKEDILQFNRETGYNLNGSSKRNNSQSEDVFLSFDAWVKNTMKKPEEMFNYPGAGKIPLQSLLKFVEVYSDFKIRNRKIDFGDMLTAVYKEKLLVDCKVQMYDEAQDMTLLMYEISKLWSANADYVYYAGDPLQTLYPFWGASPEYFLKLPAPMVILKRSYRIPTDIWNVATEIIKCNSKRKTPNIQTKEEEGVQGSILEDNLSQFLTEKFHPKLKPESTVFHLVRSNYIGHSVAKMLAANGIPFSGIDGWTPKEMKFYNTIAKLRRGDELTKKDQLTLILYLPECNFSWMSKEQFLIELESEKSSFQSWMLNPEIWKSFLSGNPCEFIGVNKIFETKIKGALAKGIPEITKIDLSRVQIMTIHGSKGLEAVNVFVHTKISQTSKNRLKLNQNKEEESYIWYVAVTRALKNLFIVKDRKINFSIMGV